MREVGCLAECQAKRCPPAPRAKPTNPQSLVAVHPGPRCGSCVCVLVSLDGCKFEVRNEREGYSDLDTSRRLNLDNKLQEPVVEVVFQGSRPRHGCVFSLFVSKGETVFLIVARTRELGDVRYRRFHLDAIDEGGASV